MKQIIPLDEIQRSPLSVIDNVGFVFSWKGKIFRAINATAESKVNLFFQDGIIDALQSKKYIPHTSISEFSLEGGYTMVLEHKKISNVTYPHEWSFSMLKDAALFVLEINQFLSSMNYQLRDCHGYNVVFDETQPLFVDIGSLMKIPKKNKWFVAYNEFKSFYVYPLNLWSKGHTYVYNAIMNHSSSALMSQFDYNNFLHRWLIQCIPQALYNKAVNALSLYREDRLQEKLQSNSLLFQAVRYVLTWKWLPFRTFDFEKARNKIEKLSRPNYDTVWNDYHNEFFDFRDTKTTQKNKRFLRFIELLGSYTDIDSLLEIGGNQGYLSQLIAEKTNISSIVCSDYDEQAVDVLYKMLKQKKHIQRITPMVLSAMYPFVNAFESHPQDRVRCDAVVALAITHHLLLTQGIPIDQMFKTMSGYCNKYIFIEFMPLGLWDGEHAPPKTPEWYTEEFFSDSLSKFFVILQREVLDKNRTLFVGKKK